MVVMGFRSSLSSFNDGRRPTVYIRAIHERMRARLGPSSGLRRQTGYRMRKTPVTEHQLDHAHQSTRYPSLHQVRRRATGWRPVERVGIREL
jgi:hypothetical protein